MDDLSSNEYDEIVQILGEQVKSLLILPIENTNNVYGYLRMAVNYKRIIPGAPVGQKQSNDYYNILLPERSERGYNLGEANNFMAYHDTLWPGFPIVGHCSKRSRLHQVILWNSQSVDKQNSW